MDINISTTQPTPSTPNDVETIGTNMISLTPGRLATNAPIGGGSPWTKDGTKADLVLNLYVRQRAIQELKQFSKNDNKKKMKN